MPKEDGDCNSKALHAEVALCQQARRVIYCTCRLSDGRIVGIALPEAAISREYEGVTCGRGASVRCMHLNGSSCCDVSHHNFSHVCVFPRKSELSQQILSSILQYLCRWSNVERKSQARAKGSRLLRRPSCDKVPCFVPHLQMRASHVRQPVISVRCVSAGGDDDDFADLAVEEEERGESDFEGTLDAADLPEGPPAKKPRKKVSSLL